MTPPPSPAGPNRTVRAPVTRHERARSRYAAGTVTDRPLTRPWPADATFACEPDGPVTATGPDMVRLTVVCADVPEPMVARGFEFGHAETSAFLQWRRLAPCPATGRAHVWEPRGMPNGCGFCAGCDLFAADVIDLAEVGSLCVVCATPSWWSHVKSAPGAADREAIEQARIVCRDCSPPEADEILDWLCTHPDSVEAVTVVAWLEGFLDLATVGALWAAVASGDRSSRRAALEVLEVQVADARAHLVDELIAGRVDPDQVRALTATPFTR